MSRGILRLVLSDQLTAELSSLSDLAPERDVVLMAETFDEATARLHHRRSLAFRFSAMRHFAAELTRSGIRVDYLALDDPDNSGALRSELVRAVARHGPERVVVTLPERADQAHDMAGWEAACGVPVERREDDRFFWSRAEFADWAERCGRPAFPAFYRAGRRRSGLLMSAHGRPAGDRWLWGGLGARRTDDAEAGTGSDARFRFAPDSVTAQVLTLVDERFSGHPGSLEGFWFAVTAEQAAQSFDRVRRDLAAGQRPPTLATAALGLYLNAGLLSPRTLCRRLEEDWRQGCLPLPVAEAMIRRVLGWREYSRGLYWLGLGAGAERSRFNAFGPVPEFFASADIDLRCLQHCLESGQSDALGDPDLRLTLISAFALATGVAPRETADWLLAEFADAREWTDQPALLAGLLPPATSPAELRLRIIDGNHIRRRWGFCRECQYHPERATGIGACPLTVLGWNLLMTRRDSLGSQPHLARRYRRLDAMAPEQWKSIRSNAEMFLKSLA